MIRIIFCALLATALCGCRSHKETVSKSDFEADSVAVSSATFVGASIDSAFRRFDMDFDTLLVTLRLDSAELSQRVEFRAVRGRIHSRSRQYRDAIKAHQRLDTVAFNIASNDSTTEHTASTAVYDPPNTTAIIVVLTASFLLAIALHHYFNK